MSRNQTLGSEVGMDILPLASSSGFEQTVLIPGVDSDPLFWMCFFVADLVPDSSNLGEKGNQNKTCHFGKPTIWTHTHTPIWVFPISREAKEKPGPPAFWAEAYMGLPKSSLCKAQAHRGPSLSLADGFRVVPIAGVSSLEKDTLCWELDVGVVVRCRKIWGSVGCS